MEKIAVVAAMAKEYEVLQKYLGNPVKTDIYGDFVVNEYVVSGKHVYCINSGVGELSATAATQYVLLKFNPDVVFNFGLAGGIANSSKIGGLYLITGIVHYDYDTSALDGTRRGQYSKSIDPVYPTDENLRNAVKAIFPDLKEGICASGDKFVADEAFKNSLKTEFDASVCEMEAAGVFFTSKNAGVPSLFIKAVSDDGTNAEDFLSFLDNLNNSYGKLLKKLVENL